MKFVIEFQINTLSITAFCVLEFQFRNTTIHALIIANNLIYAIEISIWVHSQNLDLVPRLRLGTRPE